MVVRIDMDHQDADEILNRIHPKQGAVRAAPNALDSRDSN